MSQTHYTTQLHAKIEGGPWTSVAIHPTNDPYGPINWLIFEVGEPVHVAREQEFNEEVVDPKVWYLISLDEGPSGHRVMVGATRTKPEMRVTVHVLRKLDPLLRLAAEASDGPTRV